MLTESAIEMPASLEVRAGYKQTEQGWIPEDWEVRKIGDISIIKTGSTPPTNDRSNYGDDFFFVGPGDLGFSKYIKDAEKKLSNKGFSISRAFPKNTILFTCIGSTIGKSGIAEKELTSNQQINAVFPNEMYETDYLYYVLNFISPNIKGLASEQAVPMINKNDFEQTIISLPPKKEQAAIATALNDIDSYISRLEKLITKKRQIKQGAMQKLLTPKKDWEVKTFDELFIISGGLSASREQLGGDGICYLHYGDIHGAKKNFLDTPTEQANIPKLNLEKSKVPKNFLLGHGDIVFVDASEDDKGVSRHIIILNPPEIPLISGLHTIVAKSRNQDLNIDFKQYIFQMEYIKNQFNFYAVGTKVSGVSKSSIKKIEVRFPAVDAQKRIGSTLKEMDLEIQSIEQKLKKARQVKQGMMQELLTGRIRLV